MKHVAVLTVYKILCVCVFVCVSICMYIYCALCGLDNKLYKMHGTYIKIFYFLVDVKIISRKYLKEESKWNLENTA